MPPCCSTRWGAPRAWPFCRPSLLVRTLGAPSRHLSASVLLPEHLNGLVLLPEHLNALILLTEHVDALASKAFANHHFCILRNGTQCLRHCLGKSGIKIIMKLLKKRFSSCIRLCHPTSEDSKGCLHPSSRRLYKLSSCQSILSLRGNNFGVGEGRVTMLTYVIVTNTTSQRMTKRRSSLIKTLEAVMSTFESMLASQKS
jgi:hypothetical protein